VSIDLTELMDFYIKPLCGSCAEMTEEPVALDIWSFEIDGEEWLTDRHWLLPRSECIVGIDFKVEALPAANVAKCAEWIAASRDGELRPASGEFNACWAGVLTRAGYVARSCGIPVIKGLAHAPHALVGPGDRRSGAILMPLRKTTSTSAPMPVSDRVLALHTRVAALDTIRPFEAWDVAVGLVKAAQ
jgi:hypothetical protein